MPTIVARWQDWSGRGLEHLVLKEGSGQIVAAAAVLGVSGNQLFAAHYKICCDPDWRVRSVELHEIGSDRTLELASNGAGNWSDGSGATQPQLAGAMDVDISITPFTNTLPIRRLGLKPGESAEIAAVYVRLPELTAGTDLQRYTCLEPRRRYRYESLDSDFMREIETDEHGLVTLYPGLFRRIL